MYYNNNYAYFINCLNIKKAGFKIVIISRTANNFAFEFVVWRNGAIHTLLSWKIQIKHIFDNIKPKNHQND